MKTNYTTTRFYVMLLLAIATSTTTKAQVIEHLNTNNVNAGIGIGGNLFTHFDWIAWSVDSIPMFKNFESPKGSGISSVFTAALWMSGIDSSFGVPHCAAQRFMQVGRDYFDGPIAATYDSLYDNFYHRVFKVTRTQIDMHRTNTFPIHATRIDNALLYWPARGNQYVSADYGVNITAPLAPFTDVDGDQMYNPANGDYPDICGDEAIFFVFNDVREGFHYETGTPNVFGFEIRGMAEVYIDNDTSHGVYEKRALNNTVFIRYEIENKSQETYNDFYLGMFEDIDLGCFSNDRVGSDTIRSLMFAYNEGFDTDCIGVSGYGSNKVAHGLKFLNQPMSAYIYFTNGAMASQTDPASASQYRSYLQGFWNDGTPFTYGGKGYNTGSPTKFMFSGDPNNPSEWSEISGGMQAGDRRVMGSLGPTTFAAGAIHHFDMAFTNSYDSTSTNLQIVDTLKRDADIIQAFYNNNIVGCGNQMSVGINEKPSDQWGVALYPNPASDKLFIKTDNGFVQQVTIYNAIGSLISQTDMTLSNYADVSSLPRGVYIAEIKMKQATVKKRWVKM
ncbi:MAG: T9SS type A sorting domain-containing protein [Bacteroidota bacterium]